ncbi:MAG: hypothetical protein COB66_00090 [Coxiella sp. (in: Bacteria)]|nr:MAG: hypothetical protein COB66_00090 [Coxiella sp. (in: g-proteobacteria)]
MALFRPVTDIASLRQTCDQLQQEVDDARVEFSSVDLALIQEFIAHPYSDDDFEIAYAAISNVNKAIGMDEDASKQQVACMKLRREIALLTQEFLALTCPQPDLMAILPNRPEHSAMSIGH